MISPDLAPSAPGPVPARGGAKPAEGMAPERAFAEFVEGAPAETGKAEAEPPDLIAMLDVPAPPSTPAPALPDAPAAALLVAARSSSVASLPNAEDAEPTGADRAVSAPSAPSPGHPLTPTATLPEAPGAKLATPAVAAVVSQSGDASPGEAKGEREADPETSGRGPSASAAHGATPAAVEARPIAAPAPPPAFDLALQPASAQSWKLSAVSAEAAQAAREPAPAPSPRDVAGQITVAIAQSTQPQVEIRLDPPELGRVQIRLNPTEAGLQAVVLAERPETQEFLRRHADTLVRDLTDAGYAQVSLEFAAGGEAAPRDAPADQRRPSASFEVASAPVPDREAPRRVAAGGLDIRL